MQNKLQEIVQNTRQEVSKRKKSKPEAELYTELNPNENYGAFYNALLSPKKGDIAIIAEIKHASPSAGKFNSSLSALDRVKAYEKAYADAISYVSDHHYFGGSLKELRQIPHNSSIPVLQMDFIIDMYQIVEACINKVSALLLIARIVDERELRLFVDFAQLNNIEPVVEVYNEDDLAKALKTNTRVIGVNARNLDTFTLEPERACSLLQMVPTEIMTIGFSGISKREDVVQYKEVGAKAVLVGSSLMEAEDIESVINTMKGL